MTATTQGHALFSQTVPPVPPIRIVRPAVPSSPLLVASPHSGRQYPPAFLAASRLDPHTLRRSEDCFVDELLDGAPGLGIPLLTADFPRAYCDVNREQWELDPEMFEDSLPPWCNTRTARVGAGFGTIARLVGSGQPIYAGKLSFTDAEDRIRTCWQPYHAALSDLIDQTRQQFGACILLDCHSMPTSGLSGQTGADFVLGDAHGTSCDLSIVRGVQASLESAGFTVRRNDPYAGAYTTRHYGRPGLGIHTLQVEIARHLYMDQRQYRKLPGFGLIQSTMTTLLRTLAVAQAAAP
jgi:N-formylglutamate amidohydrolase